MSAAAPISGYKPSNIDLFHQKMHELCFENAWAKKENKLKARELLAKISNVKVRADETQRLCKLYGYYDDGESFDKPPAQIPLVPTPLSSASGAQFQPAKTAKPSTNLRPFIALCADKAWEKLDNQLAICAIYREQKLSEAEIAEIDKQLQKKYERPPTLQFHRLFGELDEVCQKNKPDSVSLIMSGANVLLSPDELKELYKLVAVRRGWCGHPLKPVPRELLPLVAGKGWETPENANKILEILAAIQPTDQKFFDAIQEMLESVYQRPQTSMNALTVFRLKRQNAAIPKSSVKITVPKPGPVKHALFTNRDKELKIKRKIIATEKVNAEKLKDARFMQMPLTEPATESKLKLNPKSPVTVAAPPLSQPSKPKVETPKKAATATAAAAPKVKAEAPKQQQQHQTNVAKPVTNGVKAAPSKSAIIQIEDRKPSSNPDDLYTNDQLHDILCMNVEESLPESEFSNASGNERDVVRARAINREKKAALIPDVEETDQDMDTDAEQQQELEEKKEMPPPVSFYPRPPPTKISEADVGNIMNPDQWRERYSGGMSAKGGMSIDHSEAERREKFKARFPLKAHNEAQKQIERTKQLCFELGFLVDEEKDNPQLDPRLLSMFQTIQSSVGSRNPRIATGPAPIVSASRLLLMPPTQSANTSTALVVPGSGSSSGSGSMSAPINTTNMNDIKEGHRLPVREVHTTELFTASHRRKFMREAQPLQLNIGGKTIIVPIRSCSNGDRCCATMFRGAPPGLKFRECLTPAEDRYLETHGTLPTIPRPCIACYTFDQWKDLNHIMQRGTLPPHWMQLELYRSPVDVPDGYHGKYALTVVSGTHAAWPDPAPKLLLNMIDLRRHPDTGLIWADESRLEYSPVTVPRGQDQRSDDITMLGIPADFQ